MYGICGITAQCDRALIERMTQTFAHRRPDGEGIEHLDGTTLGDRRLAVLDLSDARRQSMPREDSTIRVAFSGKIYNFQQLREDLATRGHRFKSRSDAEYISHLYEEGSDKFLNKVEGMFALGIWDALDRSLFLARDRIGERPLYYAHGPSGHLAFASEMEALLTLPWVSRDIDLGGLDEYLSYLYVPAPRTIFRDIRELPPGHAALWRDGQLKVWRYWSPPSELATTAATPEEIRELFERSVKSMLVADVPLGAFLSGGIDSSSIVATLSRNSSRPVKTFTVTFGEEGALYDERHRARRVSEVFGTEHTEIQVRADAAQLLEPMLRHFAEPFGNPTALLTYIMARETKKHVTVAFAGDGGDEVFAGYPRYRGLLWAQRVSALPGALTKGLSAVSGLVPESIRGRHWLRRVREFLSTADRHPRDAYASWVGCFSPEQKQKLYAGELRCELERPPVLIETLLDESAQLPPVGMAQRCDLQSSLPFNCLRYVDRMSSAHALEMRLPMLNRRLLECALVQPDRLKIHSREQKLLFRQAMRGIIPEEILHAPKVGLNPPMGVWIAGELRPLVEQYLGESAVRRRGIFEAPMVDQILGEHLGGRRDFSCQIWSLVVLEQWFRMYQD